MVKYRAIQIIKMNSMKHISIKWALFTLGYLITVGVLVAYLTLPKMPSAQLFKDRANLYDVEILRDNLGIPHIYGIKDTDTAFGLGYAQSEDDFATLQSVLLATRGTLAAELGYQAAKTDFVVQFMGVWDTVNTNYDSQVPEKIKLIAQAYADGVNLYSAENLEAVSRYFLPVTAKDIIAGFTFKTPMFYGFDKVLGNLIDPDQPHELAASVNDKNANALIWQPDQSLPIGSQGIAIAPSRSEDGLTHLLVNSHQPLTGPVAWYEARLHSEQGWNMVGSTFPGSPVIIHGHNENLGWANTVNKPDLVDIYKITVNPDNENEYRLDGEWKTFKTKVASMQIKILGPIRWTVNKEIKITDHGPVMETDHGLYAVRWAGMNEVRTLEFMFATNKAGSQAEFEAALKLNAMPSINFVYADKAGNIAHYYNAKFPDRIEGWQWDKILPGDRSELIWQGYRDFSMMPKTVNPKSGLVYNANNPPWMATDGDDDAQARNYPTSMGIETFVTNRALRIEAILKQYPKISKQLLKQVKYDLAYDPKSNQIKYLDEWLKSQTTNDFNEQEKQAFYALAHWNFSTHKTNTQAALAVLTLAPVQAARGAKVEFSELTTAFKAAVVSLTEHFGSVAVPYGEIYRLIRGDKNLAISGGPDVLRAVYGKEMSEHGEIQNIAGDGFMMFVSWDKDGLVSSEASHQYGSATLDETSPHYNDQMEMFAAEKQRPVLFNRSQLEKQVERRYRPGH
jgi:penicillin amidase/acyl-homoserine-lactone acylase